MSKSNDSFDPRHIVESHAAAVAAGLVDPADRAIRLAAYVGQKLRENIARCDRDLSRTHEGMWPQIREEQEAARADLQILEVVPALKASIMELGEVEVADIWMAYGNEDAEHGDD
ncbi:hypothetical protein G3T14_15405 [Methylobacterium sp. BTF04]|uniref:hypothetical protein n=1 Tax=Methylobacterium sp. BTF04 TaxID=2708300 RepID=UPI0013D1577F|nr:hypothetical protein [Methylobacterium sp. BTF04]NEU13508.1 hypothetical protein [Methylobacterium sp. BTF04]